MPDSNSKILFIVNPGAGNRSTDWPAEIRQYFDGKHYDIELFDLPNPCRPEMLRDKIEKTRPAKVVAVGGDGTVKLIAEIVQHSKIPLGLLPAGSANGMARELGIPAAPAAALDTIVEGKIRKIHLLKINNETCIHLSDVGFNAFVVKKFQHDNVRGMWGYFKAAWKVLWSHSRMTVILKTDGQKIKKEAVMVVLANATMYGNGVVINPEGTLYDDVFEVVVIKKVSFTEIFKMRFTKKQLNPEKTEVFQTTSIQISSRHRMHFQVDGEYRGKVKTVHAEIVKDGLNIISPE
jgi:diacylglycerol kinase (ATP)